MKRRERLYAQGIGRTPLRQARRYHCGSNLLLKLEKANPDGSVKDRTACYLLGDLEARGLLKQGNWVVESSSGNLAISLARQTRGLGVRFYCVADPTVVPAKLRRLEEEDAVVEVVGQSGFADFRSARIARTRELATQPGWVWPNQYDNPAGWMAHFETTGPEIWRQTRGRVEIVVAAVGTGGTLFGTGAYLKGRKPAVTVVAVEPEGSTIFGGEAGPYLSAGAGLVTPSGIVRDHARDLDACCHVSDQRAIDECRRFRRAEGISVGITSGMALVVAARLARLLPDRLVVAIVPDGGENYRELLEGKQREVGITVG